MAPSKNDSIFGPSRPDSSDDESGSIFGSDAHTGPGFDDASLGAWLAAASEADLDAAPFGIVKVDERGTILFYNETEAAFANVAPEEAVGRNFFTEVAPCTNNRVFRGRYEEHAGEDRFSETYTYTLTYRMAPTLVDVRLLREDGASWVLIDPREPHLRRLFRDDETKGHPHGDV